MRSPGALTREAVLGALAGLQLSLGLNVLSALAHVPAAIVTIALLAASLWQGQLPLILLPALAGYGAAILAAAEGAKRAGFKAHAADLLALPAYWILQTPAIIRGLREIGGQSYVWAKTEHGVTASHRMAPDEPPDHAHPHGAVAGAVHLQRVA